jgi:glycosyltransferase involved in cell wall biosynthesis
MKILFVTEYFPVSTDVEVRGGVEQRTFRISALLAQDHHVTILANSEGAPESRHTVGNVNVIRFGHSQRYRQTGGYIKRMRYVISCVKHIRKNEYDVIVLENFLTYVVGLLLPKKLKARCVLTYHDVWVGNWTQRVGLWTGLLGSTIERLVLRSRWKHIIAVSEWTKSQLLTHGVRSADVTVLYYGVDEQYIRSITPEKFASPTVIAVSRLVKYKHVDVIVRAFAKVLLRLPNTQLVIIGTGPEQSKLQKLVRRLSIGESVRFRGFTKSHDDVIAAMKGSSVFCHASSVEGFGIVVLEAMAAGSLCVCTAIPPIQEITNGTGGLLVDVNDVQQYASAIVRALTDVPMQRAVRMQAEKRVRRFAWDVCSREVMKAFASITPSQ